MFLFFRTLTQDGVTVGTHVVCSRFPPEAASRRALKSGVAVEADKIVFFVAIVLFAISAITGLVRGRSPTVP